MQRRHREEERREQAGRAAEGDPAQPVDEIHRGGPRGHREQPAQQEVRPGVDDERRLRQQVPVAEQPPHRRRQHVQRAGQVEVERRIEEELRVQVAARGGEGLGHHHALVGVDEAVRQAPGDALEAQRQSQDEDGGEQDAGEADAAPAAGGAGRSRAGGGLPWPRRRWPRRGSSSTAPVWQAGPAGSTARSTVSWSQSSRTDTTRWTLPLVPPLCHSSRRLRLQKCASPVRSVARSASSFGVGDHEHLAAVHGLDHAGHQAVGVVAHELEERVVVHHAATARPQARSSCMMATPALVPMPDGAGAHHALGVRRRADAARRLDPDGSHPGSRAAARRPRPSRPAARRRWTS